MSLPVPKRLQGPSPSHARAVQQEKLAAKRTGGKRTPASGAGPQKGDVRLKGFLRIECKTTRHASFSVTSEMLDKLEAAAAPAGEVPMLEVELELGKRRAVVLPQWALELVVEALKGRT